MRILPLDELPAAALPQLAALKWLDSDAPQDIRFVRTLVRRGFPTSPYFGLYAVEEGQILSKIETLHLPFVSGAGRETVLGVTDVVTRPDALGRGLAGQVLEEVHRRARAAGLGLAFLWTRRSWSAHRLYERLGYRDVFSPPSALRVVPRRSPPGAPARRFSLRRAGATDARTLERLFDGAVADRWGFFPRFRGSFRLKHDLGWRPLDKHYILRDGRRVVGYAYASAGPFAVEAQEVVIRDPADAEGSVAALERMARGKWLAFGTTTFVADHRGLLTQRGYATYDAHHLTLMASDLGSGVGSGPSEGVRRACADPRFACHRGEVF